MKNIDPKGFKDIINKFNNGKERFNTSPTFNKVVYMLVQEVDPIKIIDQLIDVADESHNALLMHLTHKDNV